MNFLSPLFVSALLLAAAAAPLMACDAGNPKACTVLCGSEGECPDGLSCGTDSYCHGDDETPGSCTENPPDAALIDGSITDVDAPGPGPDAPEGDADPCAGVTSVAGVNETNVFIPDDDAFGVTSAIQIDDECGVLISAVELRLDIVHPFRGDLEAFLTSPGGERAQIFMTSTDPSDDVHEAFDVLFTPGRAAAGEWLLEVRDLGPMDLGTLDRWSIGINEPAP